MCIAILKRKNGVITDEALKESFESNRDGAGIAYTLNNELKIVKGIFDVKTFIKTVREIEQICDNNMLIHCRIGTSGKKDATNTHPFSINNDVCLIHNGILDIKVPKDSHKNDTQLFIESYLKNIDKTILMHDKGVQKLLEKAIGYSNKFVLMDNTGYYRIINEDAGHWKDNVWYSNSSYLPRTIYYYSGCYTKGVYGKDYIYPRQSSFWDTVEDDDDYCEYRYLKEDKEPEVPEEQCITQEDFDLIIDEISSMKLKDFNTIGENPAYSANWRYIDSKENAELYGMDDFIELIDISEDLYEFYMDTKEALEEEAKEGQVA